MDTSASRLASRSALRTHDFLHLVSRYKWRWIIPSVVITAAAGIYALTMSETWEVSQGIMVRNNAIAHEGQPGEFRGNDTMRTVEETIVEVCMSNHVLAAALNKVGPPAGLLPHQVEDWPGAKSVQQLREAISFEAPNGAEFGTTEVFYLRVRQSSPERGTALLESMYQHLQRRLGELRDARASGLLAELQKIVAIAEQGLKDATLQLQTMEKTLGEDFVELRMLQSNSVGPGQRFRTLAEMDQEIVRHRSQTEVNNGLLEFLQSAKENPSVFVSAPPDLLTSYPVLLQLREGLVAARLRTAALRRNLTDEYPTVRAALGEEEAIRDHIFSEIENAARAVEADTQIRAGRLPILEEKRAEMQRRLAKLADYRAEYTNLANLVDIRQQSLREAEQHLADARAQQAVARTSSLISPVDAPLRGHKPVGPSRLAVGSVGLFGGLVCGLGILFLTVVEQPAAGKLEVAGSVQPVPMRGGSQGLYLATGERFDTSHDAPPTRVAVPR